MPKKVEHGPVVLLEDTLLSIDDLDAEEEEDAKLFKDIAETGTIPMNIAPVTTVLPPTTTKTTTTNVVTTTESFVEISTMNIPSIDHVKVHNNNNENVPTTLSSKVSIVLYYTSFLKKYTCYILMCKLFVSRFRFIFHNMYNTKVMWLLCLKKMLFKFSYKNNAFASFCVCT